MIFFPCFSQWFDQNTPIDSISLVAFLFVSGKPPSPFLLRCSSPSLHYNADTMPPSSIRSRGATPCARTHPGGPPHAINAFSDVEPTSRSNHGRTNHSRTSICAFYPSFFLVVSLSWTSAPVAPVMPVRASPEHDVSITSALPLPRFALLFSPSCHHSPSPSPTTLFLTHVGG